MPRQFTITVTVDDADLPAFLAMTVEDKVAAIASRFLAANAAGRAAEASKTIGQRSAEQAADLERFVADRSSAVAPVGSASVIGGKL